MKIKAICISLAFLIMLSMSAYCCVICNNVPYYLVGTGIKVPGDQVTVKAPDQSGMTFSWIPKNKGVIT